MESKWGRAVLAIIVGACVGATIAGRDGKKTARSSSPIRADPLDPWQDTGELAEAGISAGESRGLGSVKRRSSIRRTSETGPGPFETGSQVTDRTAGPRRNSPLPAVGFAALEPLSAAKLKGRVIDIFPIGYLTLMAIIQAAAFGLLLNAMPPLLSRHLWSFHAWMALTQSFATGLTVVIVTHEYLLLTVVVRWVPTILDTLIPYLLGFGEIWMALAIGHGTSWWMALSSLCAVAVFAFWHTRTRITEDAFGDGKLNYEQNRRSVTWQIALSVAMLIVSAYTALLNSYYTFPAILDIGLTWAVILMGVYLLLIGERNQNKLYDRYLVPRWHPRNRS